MKKATWAALAVVILMAAPGQAQQTYNLTLSGASPGGLWSSVGTGMAAAIAKQYPGSTVTYQTSSGGLANVPMVAQGKVPMGIAADGELAMAVNGTEPFTSPVKGVKTLVRVYGADSRFQMTHIVVSKAFADKHGIKTFADIVAKKAPLRVAINRRGNYDGEVSELLMDGMGASIKAIESWGGQVVRAASKEQASLYQDRRIDMLNFGLAFNHPSLQEATQGVPSILLTVPKEVVEKAIAKLGGEVCQVKQGEYAWSPDPATTYCGGAVIVVADTMDTTLAYNIVKAMVEQIGEFGDKSHRSLKENVTAKTLAIKSVAPFHPGAEKLFKEKGLM